ncbi:MAG: adenylate/guanylate cyclase domain-containing protein [Euzebya sp.]
MGPIRYAKNGDVHLAYRTVGEGESDVLWIPGWFGDIEEVWHVPGFAEFLEELAGLGRLILFDKRGTGQSDRVPEHQYASSWEERVGDVMAVMDAVGSARAALIGASEGGTQALLTAAREPDRVTAVVSIAGWVRMLATEQDPEFGISRQQLEAFLAKSVELWGTGKSVGVHAPSRADDPLFVERWATFERRAASPNAVEAYGRMMAELDIRAVLDEVRVPTLLVHSTGDRMVAVDQSRYLARHLPDARLVEVPGADHLPFISHPEIVLEEIQRHLIGSSRPQAAPRRQFAAVLFTDIVGSTDRAAASGDRAWRSLLDAYEDLAQRVVGGLGGEVVKSTGDGTLATFADPQAAVLTARRLHREVAPLGVKLRAGLHCGQVEVRGDDVGGIAVHIAARVTGLATAHTTLVSSTVRDVLLGSGLEFAPHGTHELKGIPGEWTLFELDPA